MRDVIGTLSGAFALMQRITVASAQPVAPAGKTVNVVPAAKAGMAAPGAKAEPARPELAADIHEEIAHV